MLMVQKSGKHQLRLEVHPIIYDGCCTSQVVFSPDFWTIFTVCCEVIDHMFGSSYRTSSWRLWVFPALDSGLGLAVICPDDICCKCFFLFENKGFGNVLQIHLISWHLRSCFLLFKATLMIKLFSPRLLIALIGTNMFEEYDNLHSLMGLGYHHY